MTAIQKIKDGAANTKDARVPKDPIAEYLIKKCGDDEALSALVVQEHKTFEKCLNFVYEQAHKHLNGANGYIDDNEVFLMAEDYFRFDDEELEKKKAEQEAKQKAKQQKEQEERAKKAEQEQARKKEEAKAKKEAARITDGQLTLFDLV